MSSHFRIDYEAFREIAPASYEALIALGKSAEAHGLDKGLIELVKLRASQINGCAFCVQHHLNIARALKVEGRKLDLVAAWRDAGIFDARECAALDWTECATRLAPEADMETAWRGLQDRFSQAEIVSLSVAIATINAWNRLGVGLRFSPPAEIRRA